MSEIPQEQIQGVEQDPQVVKSVRKSRGRLIWALIAAIGLPVIGGGSMAIYAKSQESENCDIDTIINELNRGHRSPLPKKEENKNIKPDSSSGPGEKPSSPPAPQDKKQKRINNHSEEDDGIVTMMA